LLRLAGSSNLGDPKKQALEKISESRGASKSVKRWWRPIGGCDARFEWTADELLYFSGKKPGNLALYFLLLELLIFYPFSPATKDPRHAAVAKFSDVVFEC